MTTTIQKTTNPIKYFSIRIEQLTEELEKNPSEENHMIIGKAIAELSYVLDLMKRRKLLSMNPYKEDYE